jgi:hypothetical protein
MNIFHENDVVRLREKISATVIDGGEILISAGAIGTIVIVYGDSNCPLAYEVEFFIPEHNDFALATVDADVVTVG